MTLNTKTPILSNTSGLDYELIDFGKNRKLERFGSVILNRPEGNAKNSPSLGNSIWEKAHWYFYEEKGKKGVWHAKNKAPENWSMDFTCNGQTLKLNLELTHFKHVGIFPEQAENWHFISQMLKQNAEPKPSVLNLFSYTGIASIVASKFGADVTSIDSVKQVLTWGKSCAEENQITNIKWIQEDARDYVKKCLRRGLKFDGIIMDPPSFGRGLSAKVWKIEDHLSGLLSDAIQLLKPNNSWLILNTYSPHISDTSIAPLLKDIGKPKQKELVKLGIMSRSQQQLPLGYLLRFVS